MRLAGGRPPSTYTPDFPGMLTKHPPFSSSTGVFSSANIKAFLPLIHSSVRSVCGDFERAITTDGGIVDCKSLPQPASLLSWYQFLCPN